MFNQLRYLIGAIPGKFSEMINRIYSPLFIALILALFFLRFELNGNEEHYMQLAKQFYEPEWVPGSFTFTEFAGTKVLYQYLVGFLLQYFSFETVVGIFRFLLCILFAFPLAKLYSLLKINNSWVLLHLPILYLFQGNYLYNIIYNQSFFGGEWIFLSVEPKSFAYILVFYSLYYLLTEKYVLAVILLAFSSYFHILVGGWILIYFSLYHLIKARTLRAPLLNGILYIIFLLPFLIYLGPTLHHSFSANANAEEIDWIFTYFKQPNHTAIFVSLDYFIERSLPGVQMTLFFFLLCLFVFPRYKQAYNQNLNRLNILLFLGTVVSLVLAYFDKTGAFVKYFPFRISALFCFLVFLQLVIFLRHYALRKVVVPYAAFIVISWFLVVVAPRHFKNLTESTYTYFSGNPEYPAYEAICEYIRQNTPRNAKILFLPEQAKVFLSSGELEENDLMAIESNLFIDGHRDMVRKTERDRYVFFFAAPVSPDTEKTLDWFRRINLKRAILTDQKDICSAIKGEGIVYVLTDYDLEKDNCYFEIHQNENYHLYQVDD